MRRTQRLTALVGALLAALAVTAVSLGVTRAAPSNTSLPSISGAARDGSILTASHGSWTGNPKSYDFQWQRCDSSGGSCNPISGATSKQYTLTSADVGNRIRVQVTASNATGN